MNIRKNIRAVCLLVAVCLPPGLVSPLQSKNGPPKKAAPPNTVAPVIEPCPIPNGNLLLPVIDVCKSIGNISATQSQASAETQIELRKRGPVSIWLAPHKDYTLRATQDQVAWTCKGGKSFQILKIQGILNPN